MFDIASLRTVPNLTICSPLNETELRNMMYTAQLEKNIGPWVIRYPRGRGSLTDWRTPMQEIEIGTAKLCHEGNVVCVLSYGPIGVDVERAISMTDDNKTKICHYDMRFVKPLDEITLNKIARYNYKKIITIEDGSLQGGFGGAIAEWLEDNGIKTPLIRMGLPDRFVEHGRIDELRRITRLDINSILETLTTSINNS